MTNYDDWTDFQVSEAVAILEGHSVDDEQHINFGDRDHNIVIVNDGVDYCNNPSDMWPIIVGHNILIRPRPETDIGKPFASDIRGIHVTRCIDNNGLLRASAIVYLKMEEAKNGH